MKPDRTKLIIAVFGGTGSGPIALAKNVGSNISKHGYILLTGGIGKGTASVKEQAILGAQLGPWIGVDRDLKELGYTVIRGGKAFIVQTDLDHKRNCLEACLCDAAVALEGEDGTASEAVSCLCLGKPVVFIGDSWKKYGLELSGESVKYKEMVDAALKRVGKFFEGSEKDEPLDKLFKWDEVPQNLRRNATYQWLPSPTDEASGILTNALDWLRKCMPALPQGYFPEIERYDFVIDAYNRWVRTL